jgi:hypothetical protein
MAAKSYKCNSIICGELSPIRILVIGPPSMAQQAPFRTHLVENAVTPTIVMTRNNA